MASSSLESGASATDVVVRMQPDSASAVTMAMIGNRNARATRTGAIPHGETTPVLHRLWLTIRFFAAANTEGRRSPDRNQAAMPAPIGHDTPVPPSPQ